MFEIFSKIDHDRTTQIKQKYLFNDDFVQINSFTQYYKQTHEIHTDQTNQFFDEKTRFVVTHTFRNQKNRVYRTRITLHDETNTLDMKQKIDNRDHATRRDERFCKTFRIQIDIKYDRISIKSKYAS